ncbi:Quinone oxidoreductase 2 [bioreactor metagenome]|uniref:Quinone oxidoreductase 2 n=1 Tax=bioreactor metagenome TaxID=1076179 RepID=A0A645IH79_9ZZZZ
MLMTFGLPEGIAKVIASFDTGAANNDLFDDSRQLSRLIGRPTTPLAQAVKETLK